MRKIHNTLKIDLNRNQKQLQFDYATVFLVALYLLEQKSCDDCNSGTRQCTDKILLGETLIIQLLVSSQTLSGKYKTNGPNFPAEN